MKRLKYYSLICCVSFTVVEIVLSILNVSLDPMSSNMWINNMELFLVCVCVAFLMFITDFKTGVFEMKGNIGFLNMLIHLIDVGVPVIGLGGLVFHWFNVFSIQVLLPIAVFITVYFIVYGSTYLYDISVTKNINKKILERKEEQKHDRKNHYGQ